jgi:hypothetical protein
LGTKNELQVEGNFKSRKDKKEKSKLEIEKPV